MWLNYLIDDRHFSYITKMKKQKKPCLPHLNENENNNNKRKEKSSCILVGGRRQPWAAVVKSQNRKIRARLRDSISRRFAYRKRIRMHTIRNKKAVFYTLYVLFDLRNEELPESCVATLAGRLKL